MQGRVVFFLGLPNPQHSVGVEPLSVGLCTIIIVSLEQWGQTICPTLVDPNAFSPIFIFWYKSLQEQLRVTAHVVGDFSREDIAFICTHSAKMGTDNRTKYACHWNPSSWTNGFNGITYINTTMELFTRTKANRRQWPSWNTKPAQNTAYEHWTPR